jgi:hypothetical protein
MERSEAEAVVVSGKGRGKRAALGLGLLGRTGIGADWAVVIVVKSTISRMFVGLRIFLHILWPTPLLAVPYLQLAARFVDRSERERLFHFANVTLYRSL